MNIVQNLPSFPRPVVYGSGIVFILLVALADRTYGPEVTFSLFYLLPIAFVTWGAGRKWGLLCAVLGSAMRLMADKTWWPELPVLVHTWNTGGRLVSFVGIVLMISFIQKHYSLRLRQAEEKYTRFIEAVVEGIIATDLAHMIQFVNGRGAEYLGFTSEALVGKSLLSLIPSEAHRQAVQDRLLNSSSSMSSPCEICFTRKDNSPLWVLVNTNVYRDGTNTPPELVLLLTDISDRKRTEEEMILREQQVRKLSIELHRVQEDERKNFARELHDGLSQVLTTLKIMTELALKTSRSDLESTEHHLREVVTLADEAQSEAKQIAYGLRPAILDDFGLQAAIPMLATRLEKRTGITAELHLSADGVRFDSLVETTIFRIVQELFANAAKHSEATRVVVQLLERNGTIALTVSDNGKGMDLREMQRHEDGIEHSGIRNLRERVEFLGGSFRTESMAGHGTEFLIELPAGFTAGKTTLNFAPQ